MAHTVCSNLLLVFFYNVYSVVVQIKTTQQVLKHDGKLEDILQGPIKQVTLNTDICKNSFY